MSTIFIFCALVGGTFLVCQFVMTLMGLGHEGGDLDGAHHTSDSMAADVDDPLHADVDHDINGTHHHGSSWLFGIISFRTLVAATTVFGLAGMTAHSGGMPVIIQLLVAVTGGAVAMLTVHWLMRTLYQLGQSGTLRITNAIGKTATVSIPIPGNSIGCGKVRLKVQGRLEELAATHSMEGSLATGSQVVVLNVVNGNVLEVAALQETN